MNIIYVETNDALDKAIDILKTQSEIGIDLEFDKNHYRYGFNLCLMQISTRSEVYLVDPLSKNLSIEKIFPILENPRIQKITFAFGEDIRLMHSIGCFPKNIYDLSYACALLDNPPTSLTNLILNFLGIEVRKSKQQSNWYERPLSEEQIHYAADDVIYLFDLKEKCQSEISDKEVFDWLKEENESYESIDYSDLNHNDYIKEKDKSDLSEYDWFLFSELMARREDFARDLNRPSYKIIDKNLIYELVVDPKKFERWSNLKGIHPKLKTKEMGEEFGRVYSEASEKANDLKISKTSKASETLSRNEYLDYRRQKSENERLKQRYFNPIQEEIANRYGKNVQTFVLANKQCLQIIEGDKERLLPYKVKLIKEIALDLEIPIEDEIYL